MFYIAYFYLNFSKRCVLLNALVVGVKEAVKWLNTQSTPNEKSLTHVKWKSIDVIHSHLGYTLISPEYKQAVSRL